MNYVAVVVGVSILAASAAAWAGRWRGWTRTFITAHLPVPITILPALGAQLIAFAIHDAAPSPGSRALASAALVVGLVALILAGWNPAWFGPRWFRELKRAREPIEPDRSDPLTAITYALARSDVDARARVAERFGGSVPAAHWRVSLRHGGLKIGGHLELHRTGLAFYPNQVEARMRDEPITMMLDRGEVAAVRSTGAIGVHVETTDGVVHQFEAFFPGRIVRRIHEAFGLA